MRKNMFFKIAYILCICLILSSVAFSSSALVVNEEYYNGLYELIEMLYREDLGIENIMGASLNGVFEGMGPYSCFETAYNGEDGGLTGIGANLEKVRNGFMIISVKPSSPAYKSGLRTGDIIYRVDKLNASAMGIESFRAYLNGLDSVTIEYIDRHSGYVRAVKIDCADSMNGRCCPILPQRDAVCTNQVNIAVFSDNDQFINAVVINVNGKHMLQAQ